MMNFQLFQVKDSSSVIFETDKSKILCKISFLQKTESEPSVKISFKTQTNKEEHDIVKSVIEKVINTKCAVTQIHVEYVELVKGIDAISAYLNGFNIAAKNINLDVLDQVISSCYIEKEHLACIAYLLKQKKVINFYVNGPLRDITVAYNKCLEGVEDVVKCLEIKNDK